MRYHHVSYPALVTYCEKVFAGYGFTPEESAQITEVLLAADLAGIESHGIQRLVRYHKEITGGMVKTDARPACALCVRRHHLQLHLQNPGQLQHCPVLHRAGSRDVRR